MQAVLNSQRCKYASIECMHRCNGYHFSKAQHETTSPFLG